MQEWTIDKHIPVAIIMAISLQTFTVVWWAAQLDTRVHILELNISQNSLLLERVSRVEEKVSALKEASRRIETKISAFRRKK